MKLARGVAHAALALLPVTPFHAVAQAAPNTSITMTADAKAAGKPLVHFWSKVVGAGRANEGLRATWQEELEMVKTYDGFESVRMHGIFHDDMFIYRQAEDGSPIYNFQYVDDLYDRMLTTGVRPFVELGFVPKELATTTDTTFWWQANGSVPNDYDKWAELVRHLVEHCIQRYGIDEVRQWHFEVWNEPNLFQPFFRNGSQQKYFDLYKKTVTTIKGIDPRLRVGGPATSNFHIDPVGLDAARKSGQQFDPTILPWKPIWVVDFLNYCKANDLPVDFVSTHPYPQDFAIDAPGMPRGGKFHRYIDSTRDDLRTLRKIVDASPYPKAEIHLTEWSSSPSPLDHSHDSLAAAAFIVKTNLESAGLVDSLSYWTFSDVFEENRRTDSIFHGGFGLINYQEIVKPAFHAYRFLNALGDEVLEQSAGSIVTRDSKSGLVTAVAYNYPPDHKESLPVANTLAEANARDASGAPRAFTLRLDRLSPHAKFLVETLDRTHGDAVAAWVAMGKPEPPSREQTATLRRQAWATKQETLHADGRGRLTLERTLDAWTVLLIREIPKS